jgi:hypothetical protein
MGELYPGGIDWVWVAADRVGNVGAFVTAGSGPIPVNVLHAGLGLLEGIEEVVWSLPRTSEAQILVVTKRPDDFVAMAERGLYVYDWSDVHRTARDALGRYELTAAPRSPIQARDVPSELADALSRARFDTVLFASEHTLDVRALLRCREPG